MFSVIIPLFNKSDCIKKCLQSVLNQSFNDYEIIIVNDGSTDDGPLKVKEFIIQISLPTQEKTGEPSNTNKNWCHVPYVKLINQKNAGVSTARNIGIKEAKHEFIAFLDADDWWEPTFLSEMKTLIEEYPGAGLYGSNYYLVKNNRQYPAPSGIDPNFKKGLIDYFGVYARTNCQPLWTGAIVIPKKIHESIGGFNSELKLGEDFDLWIRIALKYPVAFLNKYLSNYNQDSDIINRATGHLTEPSHHVLWNLSYLEKEEQKNPVLKKLLDNLRVYSLFPYYLKNKTSAITCIELNKVIWRCQPLLTRLKYKLPVFILKIYWCVKKQGSALKKFLSKIPNSRQQ